MTKANGRLLADLAREARGQDDFAAKQAYARTGLVTVLFRAFESNIALKEKNDGKWTQ